MSYVALNVHVVYRDLYGGLMGSQVVCSAKLNTLHLFVLCSSTCTAQRSVLKYNRIKDFKLKYVLFFRGSRKNPITLLLLTNEINIEKFSVSTNQKYANSITLKDA